MSIVRLLHIVGLTNLSDKEVEQYEALKPSVEQRPRVTQYPISFSNVQAKSLVGPIQMQPKTRDFQFTF
jgi:hypothetical protein